MIFFILTASNCPQRSTGQIPKKAFRIKILEADSQCLRSLVRVVAYISRPLLPQLKTLRAPATGSVQPQALFRQAPKSWQVIGSQQCLRLFCVTQSDFTWLGSCHLNSRQVFVVATVMLKISFDFREGRGISPSLFSTWSSRGAGGPSRSGYLDKMPETLSSNALKIPLPS